MAHLLEVNRSAVLEKFGKDDRAVQEDIRILREWLAIQPHLPPIDDERLEKFLVNCKFSLQATKDTVDTYITMRSFLRDFYADLDPLSPSMQNALRIASTFPLKHQTKDYERVILGCVWNTEDDKYNLLNHVKCMLMIEDIRNQHDYVYGNHFVLNLANLTFSQLAQYTPDMVLKIVRLYIKGYKLRFTGIHLVNPPSYVDILLKVFKYAMPEKLYKRVAVHKTLESLHERIPKEILPSDMGGNMPSSQEINEEWIKELEKNRDWFLAQQKILVDESKRPEKLHDQYFGSIHGTFKTLAVD